MEEGGEKMIKKIKDFQEGRKEESVCRNEAKINRWHVHMHAQM